MAAAAGVAARPLFTTTLLWKVNNMKKNYEEIRQEISAAVDHERDAVNRMNQMEDDARRRYQEAMKVKDQAYDTGDMELYKSAGMTAEEARLELEYLEKRNSKPEPAATQDDDHRIRAALIAEDQLLRMETLKQLREIFNEAVELCEQSKARQMEIDKAFAAWTTIVMKNDAGECLTSMETKLAIAQFANTFQGQLSRLDHMK